MAKLEQVWVVAQSTATLAELLSGAALLGEQTALCFAGAKDQAQGADQVYYWGALEAESFLQTIPGIVKLVQEQRPQLVLCETTKNGRLAAAAIGAAVGANVLTDVTEIALDDGQIVTKRMVYGGAAFQTSKATGPVAVACVGGGVFEAGPLCAGGALTEIQSQAPGIRFVERRVKQIQAVNLPAAKNVVGVGRGLGAEENLALAQELAAVLGGEVGCSRPVAEEERWLPKEVYVGVSGVMIKPDVYIACGISGQVQHMVGVNQAKTIVAVNKDKSAPIFKQCDYGIVGDLKTVLPALTAKFKG